MQATQTLPDSYRPIRTLDITKDPRLLIILNLAALLVLVVGGWLFLMAVIWLRGADGLRALNRVQISGLQWLWLILAILALTVFYVLLHEAIHGVFFWLFTHSRPKFAFKLTHAYAAAPDWYIYRNPYLVTGLAPLVVITLIGLGLIAVAPVGWLQATWFVITMNAAGAVGDMLVAAWLLRLPPTCLAQDRGDSVTLFVPE